MRMTWKAQFLQKIFPAVVMLDFLTVWDWGGGGCLGVVSCIFGRYQKCCIFCLFVCLFVYLWGLWEFLPVQRNVLFVSLGVARNFVPFCFVCLFVVVVVCLFVCCGDWGGRGCLGVVEFHATSEKFCIFLFCFVLFVVCLFDCLFVGIRGHRG